MDRADWVFPLRNDRLPGLRPGRSPGRPPALLLGRLSPSRLATAPPGSALTAALLDRLTHHAHVLLFQGESHRFRESHQRLRGPGAAVMSIDPMAGRQEAPS